MTDRTRPIQRRPVSGPDGAATPNADAPDPGRSAAQAAAAQAALAAAATQATQAAEEAAAVRAEAGAQIEQLATELEATRNQAAELVAALQRERAEFQNFRRRTTDEREREAGLAADYLLKKVLSIADDFDRAIEARPAELAGTGWAEGIGAIDRKLRGLLESEGVRPIEAVGKAFDPREHEAVTSVPSTGRPDGEIIAEIQRGYRVRDRILRPVLVAVAAGGGAGDAQADGGSSTNASTAERSN